MKFFILLCSGLFSYSQAYSSSFSSLNESISVYNQLETASDLVRILSESKHSEADTKFIKKIEIAIASDKSLKAKVSGKKIFLENKIAIEVLNPYAGLFLVNSKEVLISPDRSIQTVLAEIQSALDAKYGFLDTLLIPKANAVGPVGLAALSVYGVGAVVTGAGCATLGYGFGGFNSITTEAVLNKCTKVAAAWPYYAWKFYAALKYSHEIKSGECVTPANGKYGSLLKINFHDGVDGKPVEIYFKADVKSSSVSVFENSYNPKTHEFDQILEREPRYNQFYIGNDITAAAKLIETMQQACRSGGTPELNKLIKKDSAIRNGFSKLSENSRDTEKNNIEKANLNSTGAR